MKSRNREKGIDRFMIIRDVRVPDYFVDPTTQKREKVAASAVKAVLREVAAFDDGKRAVFCSNAYIAHSTQLSERQVARAVSVLKYHSLLRRSRAAKVIPACGLSTGTG